MESSSPPGDESTSWGTDNKKSSAQPRVRRRNRMITSCLECRRRKLKCDKLHPCTNCNKFSRECLFLAPALDSVSQQRLNEIKEKMGSLERVLEQDVARKVHKSESDKPERRTSSADLPGGEDSSSDNEAAVPEDEKGLEPTPLASIDASYGDDADDNVLDLGIKIGKMRMTERLGGFFRPMMNEELGLALDNPTTDLRTREERLSIVPTLPDEGTDFLAPGTTYIAPGSGFLFGDVGNKRSLINFLPTKAAADLLVRNYFDNVHFIARVVHWPSFQLQYDNFWTNVLAGLEPPAWQQAIVLSVLFSAVASMAEEEVTAIFARSKATILGNFQTGTEVALSKAQFLRATKVETLQALVVYLTPMCRDQLSRAHSVLVGMAVRLGECMGLHRDPHETYGMSAIECHVRRIIWFQLCFLDFRTCEAQGPRPGIKREDYDTKFPMNINDADLFASAPSESTTAWTDMTASRIRFECTEMQRVIWHDRIRLEKKKVSLTHCLGKIESFRKAMESKYAAILDPTDPIQRYAQSMMNLLIQRMYVMVLHRYLNHSGQKVPDRLREITINSGTLSMENAVVLEKTPELARWKWYNGAYQQWHIAFLLLSEVYSYPHCRQADRIWNIIDFVFEPDPTWSRTQKARTIISAIKDRTGVYRDLRRVRVPVSMKESVGLVSTKGNKEVGSPEDLRTTSTSGHAQDRVSPNPASIKAEAVDQSWSFESPATLLLDSTYVPHRVVNSIPRWNHGVRQQQPQQIPQQSAQQSPQHTSPRLEQRQASKSPGQQIDQFNSPSDSGTNESWPPLISNDQVQWRTVFNPRTQPSPSAPTVAQPPVNQQDPTNSLFGFSPAYSTHQTNMSQQIPAKPDALMLDIDWREWDQLFPPETNPGLMDTTAEFPMPRGI